MPLSHQLQSLVVLLATTLVAGRSYAALPNPLAERTGKVRVLVMRASFKNAPYTLSDADLERTHRGVNELYAAMSRQKLQFDFQVLPKTFAFPQAQDYYDVHAQGETVTRIVEQILVWLKETGLVRGKDYDHWMVNYPERPGEEWAGHADDVTGDIEINGNRAYAPLYVGHELGHSLGLSHAHAIFATDPFGTPATEEGDDEYGNVHDLMGYSNDKIYAHFGVNFKWLLGWLTPGELIEVTRSGVYRIFAHDNAVKAGRLLGIRVPSKNPRYAYWFEYRSQFEPSRVGALALFEGFRAQPDNGLHMLDMTPRTGHDEISEGNDAPLKPGNEFADKYGDARFRVLAVSAGVPNEDAWVDVEVTIPGTLPTEPSTDGGTETRDASGLGDAAGTVSADGPRSAADGDGGASSAGSGRAGAGGNGGLGGNGGRGTVPRPSAVPPPSAGESGCSCGLTQQQSPISAGWLVVLGAAFTVLRRRIKRLTG